MLWGTSAQPVLLSPGTRTRCLAVPSATADGLFVQNPGRVLPPLILLLGFRDASPFLLLSCPENQERVTFGRVFRKCTVRPGEGEKLAVCSVVLIRILIPLRSVCPLPLGSV